LAIREGEGWEACADRTKGGRERKSAREVICIAKKGEDFTHDPRRQDLLVNILACFEDGRRDVSSGIERDVAVVG